MLETPERRPPRPVLVERREALYGKIDTKVEIVTDLWQTANSLPPPLVTDSPDEIIDQDQILLGVVERSKVLLPEAFDRLDAYDCLKKRREDLSRRRAPGDRESVEEIEADYGAKAMLKSDPDLRFVLNIRDGVSSLMQRRDKLRDIQEVIGRPRSDGWFWDISKIDRMDGFPEELKGHVSRAYLGAYSINLFVDPEKYDETYKPQNGETLGIHYGFPLGHISVIKDQEIKWVRMGFYRFLRPATQETLKHEEFHALADAFNLQTERFLGLRHFISRQLEQLDQATSDSDRENKIRSVREKIMRLPDSSSEELLAEMAGTDKREGIPVSTFARYDDDKRKLVDQISVHPAMAKVDEKKIDLKSAKSRLIKLPLFRLRLTGIYFLLDEMRGRGKLDIDVLFALFHPTKIKRIRRVAERWVDQSLS